MSVTIEPRILTTVNVACAADDNYALPLAVMLRSAGRSLAEGSEIMAHVLDDGLTGTDVASIERSLPPNVRIKWCRPGSQTTGLPLWGRMTATTYQKLTLGDWLPAEVTRAIWLDCDLLVLDDLTALVESLDPGMIAGAVVDQRVPRVGSRLAVAGWHVLGLDPEEPYFNAGVMVIDVVKWRTHGVARRSFEYLERFGKSVTFWDQEALNAVLAWGHWQPLPARWNVHPSLQSMLRKHAVPEPAIVHFSGNLKPWTHPGSDLWSSLFYAILDETEWSTWRPATNMLTTMAKGYEQSRLRRWLYPLEAWGTEVQRCVAVLTSR